MSEPSFISLVLMLHSVFHIYMYNGKETAYIHFILLLEQFSQTCFCCLRETLSFNQFFISSFSSSFTAHPSSFRLFTVYIYLYIDLSYWDLPHSLYCLTGRREGRGGVEMLVVELNERKKLK